MNVDYDGLRKLIKESVYENGEELITATDTQNSMLQMLEATETEAKDGKKRAEEIEKKLAEKQSKGDAVGKKTLGGGEIFNSGKEANAKDSHSEGYLTKAEGVASHSEGFLAEAYGEGSHAEGTKYASPEDEKPTRAFADGSHAEGLGTQAGSWKNKETGEYVFEKPDDSVIDQYDLRGEGSHSEGWRTKAGEHYAHAEGGGANKRETIALGRFSHAEGGGTLAKGEASHSEGAVAEANGLASHAQGMFTKAEGQASHAEGSESIALGDASHSEGIKTSALGRSSHAQGEGVFVERRGGDWIQTDKNKIITGTREMEYIGAMFKYNGVVYTVVGKEYDDEVWPGSLILVLDKDIEFTSSDIVYSLKTGVAAGAYSCVGGYSNMALGQNCAVFGENNISTEDRSFVVGRYNSYMRYRPPYFSVGCGTADNDRKNAVEVTDKGKMYVKDVGGFKGYESFEAKDLATYLQSLEDRIKALESR